MDLRGIDEDVVGRLGKRCQNALNSEQPLHGLVT